MIAGDIVKLVLEGASFVATAIGAFIDGDDSEPVRRVIEILPAEQRSAIELARQRNLMRKALEEKLGTADTDAPTS